MRLFRTKKDKQVLSSFLLDLEDVKQTRTSPHPNLILKPKEIQGTGLSQELFQACSEGDIEEVHKLIQNSEIDINGQDSDSRTPFWIACSNGHIEVVKLLLNDERVDINKARNDASTPFYIACKRGHTEVINALRDESNLLIYSFFSFFSNCSFSS